jgi:hypothetical protein
MSPNREQFFKLPHSRAALLAGGIVWRLALEAICPGIALMGPSDTVAHFGDVLQSPDGPLVDDSLTEEELNLICGVYDVYTGELTSVFMIFPRLILVSGPRGMRTSHSSWWPKQSTWVNSGYNVGYWTAECEKWFQWRLHRILAGIEKPIPAGKWKEYMRRDRYTPFLVGENRTAAANFFEGIYAL